MTSLWHDLPATSATKMRRWSFGWQFYEAIQDRYRLAFNTCAFFPPAHEIWDSGTLSGITDNGNGTATVSVTGITTDKWHTASGCGTKRWVSFTCTPSICFIPVDYELVLQLDPQDPWTVVRGKITDQTYTAPTFNMDGSLNTAGHGTLTIQTGVIVNSVAAKFITSLSSLAASPYYIIKLGGLWYTDRRWTKPNQPEIEKGTAVDGWLDTSGNGWLQQIISDYATSPWDNDYTSTPPDPPQPGPINWALGKYKNDELLAYQSGGALFRNVIVGNSNNRVFVGNTIFKLTVSASAGTYKLAGSAPIAWNANASAIQTALAAFHTGATVTGSGPFEITFPAALGGVYLSTDATALSGTLVVSHPDAATAIGQPFSIVTPGVKADPSRQWDASFYWYNGLFDGVLSHDWDDNLSLANMPAFFAIWQNLDDLGNCINYYHNAFDVDAQIELDNECMCQDSGDFVAPNYWMSWRHLVSFVVNQLGPMFVDEANPLVNGPPPSFNNYTPATLLAQAGVGPTRKRPRRVAYLYPDTNLIPNISVDAFGTVTAIDPPAITADGKIATPTGLALAASPTGGTIPHGTTRGYRIAAVNDSGETLACSEVTVLCAVDDTNNTAATASANVDVASGIVLGLTVTNPGVGYTATPTVTISGDGTGATAVATISGGVISGLTLTNFGLGYSSATVSFSGGFDSDTYSVNGTYNPTPGASGYNVYGPVAGSEHLLIAISGGNVTSFLDDGSFIPDPTIIPQTSNTTHNNCSGVGTYIYRDRSRGYLESSDFGRSGDGSAFVNGDLACVIGDSFDTPFDGQGANSKTPDVLASYWDRFFRGKWHKTWWKARQAAMSGPILYGTKSSITVDQDWWALGNNGGQARTQGGVSTSSTSTSVTDTGLTGTTAACWAATSKFVGTVDGVSVTPWYGFTLEIYDGGSPAGWSFAADGTATYSTPSAPAHTGTSGNPPTVSAVIPGAGLTLIHAIGKAQTIYIDGNHFDPAATVTLTNTDTGAVYNPVGTVSAFGEIAISFDFGFVAANWSVVVTNPGPHASGAFTFVTKAVWCVPITSFTTSNTFNFATPDGYSGGTVGYLIPEAYKPFVFWGREILITQLDGTKLLLPIRFTNKNMAFVDPQSSALAGTFQILEYDPASVLKFSTSTPAAGVRNVKIATNQYWIEPTGTDTRITKPYSKALNANSETQYAGDTGMMRKADVVGFWIPNELQKLIQALKSVWRSFGCTNNGENNGSAFNIGPTSQSYGGGSGITFSSAVATYEGIINSAGSAGPSPNCPTSFILTNVAGIPVAGGEGECGSWFANKIYAYLQVINLSTCVTSSVDFYVWGQIDGFDTPPSTGTFPHNGSISFNPDGTGTTYHTWSVVASIGASNAAVRTSGMIGSAYTSPPNWIVGPDPVPYAAANNVVASSGVSSGFTWGAAIARVIGQFSYP